MDEKRFVAVSQQNMAAFYRTACSIVGDRHDAEDAVQQALLNAWKARQAARSGLERAWVMRIVINESYSILRRRKKCRPADAIELPAANGGLS